MTDCAHILVVDDDLRLRRLLQPKQPQYQAQLPEKRDICVITISFYHPMMGA